MDSRFRGNDVAGLFVLVMPAKKGVMMNFDVKVFDKNCKKVEVAVVPLFKKQNINELSEIEKEIFELAKQKEDFDGSTGDTVALWNFNKNKFIDVIVVGLGEAKNFSSIELRWAFSKVADKLKRNDNYSQFSFRRKEFSELDKQQKNLWKRCIVEGAYSGLYSYTKYKTEDNRSFGLPNIFYFEDNGDNKWQNYSKMLISATNFSRDLVNEPANSLTPQDLKEVALELKKEGVIDVTILNKKEMEKAKLNGTLAVASGGSTEPCVIKLQYNFNNKSADKLGIIGKCLTFDSGGLAIKEANSMEDMKTDMAGAAAVLGVFYGLSQFKPKLKSSVTGYIAACENLLDRKSMRPGDIIHYLNGKTVEILNPDAEGRLTLADMLCLAEKDGCKKIIDIATLTGACEVALGDFISGIMGNSQDIIDNLISASKISSEPLWQLPLPYFYRKKLKSIIADMSNIGGRAGGAITAGIFLKEFVTDNVEWAHLDIAGKAFYKDDYFYNPKGATGMGVKTLFEYLMMFE